MSHESEDTLLVFLKAPVRSTVKTRLAKTLGDELTVGLYVCFVQDTIMKVSALKPVTVYGYPEGFETALPFLPPGLLMYNQTGSDLGERMARALASSFENGCDKAVLMGTDAPDLPTGYLTEAFEALNSHDAVIGPCTDGGYVLIGFRRNGFSAQAFTEVPWSTPEVLKKTLEIMDGLKIKCFLLPPWNDVDTFEDLKGLIGRLETGRSEAPHTWEYIQRHRLKDHETCHFCHHPCSE